MGYKVSSFTTTPPRHPFLICDTVKYLINGPQTLHHAWPLHQHQASGITVNKLIKFQENILNCFRVTERTQIYYRNHYDIFNVQKSMTPKVGSLVKVYERKEGQLSVSAEMINS